MSSKQLVIMRHFESTKSALGNFHSDDDCGLAEVGMAQANSYKNYFEDVSNCLVSPFQRTIETADLLGVNFETDSDLIEWGLGSMQGLNSTNFRLEHGSWNLFKNGPFFGDGESLESVIERADRVCLKLTHLFDDQKTNKVLIISHGQFGKVLVARLLQFPLAQLSTWRFRSGTYAELNFIDNSFELNGFGLSATQSKV